MFILIKDDYEGFDTYEQAFEKLKTLDKSWCIVTPVVTDTLDVPALQEKLKVICTKFGLKKDNLNSRTLIVSKIKAALRYYLSITFNLSSTEIGIIEGKIFDRTTVSSHTVRSSILEFKSNSKEYSMYFSMWAT